MFKSSVVPLSLAVMVLAACASRPASAPLVEVAPPAAPAPAEATDAGVTPEAPTPRLEVADAGAPAAPTPLRSATAGQPIVAKRLWKKPLTGVGTSSPRLVDVTGDGVLDVIIGGGVQGKSGWLYALDGASGKLLWKARFAEEFYATPTLLDVTGDGVPDAFIGGRDFDFHGVDGRTGAKLWSLRAANPGADLPRKNFNGAIAVPDQDGDGIDDLVATQGGAYDDRLRKPGRIMLMSGKTGALLVDSAFPDERETYSQPTPLTARPLSVLQGTGGETLGGHLYRFTLGDGALQQTWGDPSGRLGVIATPMVMEMGGAPAAVAVHYDAEVVRYDVDTGARRWAVPFPGFEARASPAPGRFGGSGDADVVATMSKGVFPVYEAINKVVWLDGATGQVLDEVVAGVFSASSPLVVDFDGDGLDETVAIAMSGLSTREDTVVSTLTIYDGAPGRKKRLELKVTGAGWATPAVADLDGDGRLDVVFACTGVLYRFALEAPGAGPAQVRWGAFRGPTGDGRTTPLPR